MEITPKLQLQIKALCKAVPNVEWSGVLFYTTEGDFGTPDFKCTAQELFLMDIGTAGYTEYTFGPTVIKYMMDNPVLKEMHRGHIHSHCNMGVFFSGTDQSEIHTNSEFHNIYLSLIVNNANDMTAKFCFRGTCSEEVSFVNQDGKPATMQVQSKSPIFNFTFECDIEKPQMSQEDLAVVEAGTYQLPFPLPKPTQTPLFKETSQGKKSYYGANVESDLYNFIVAVLDDDIDTYKMMRQTLNKVERDLNFASSRTVADYFTKIKKNCHEFFGHFFEEGRDFQKTIGEAIMVLRNYKSEYPDLVLEIIDHLNILKRFKAKPEKRNNSKRHKDEN